MAKELIRTPKPRSPTPRPELVDIVEFLSARFDEEHADAVAAQEADPAPWRANTTNRGSTYERDNHGSGLVIAGDDTALWDCEGSNTLCMTAPTARHVARWDPTRVLREVEAKRAILALHAPIEIETSDVGGDAWAGTVCYACEGGEGWPCTTLRHLAAACAYHPDYKPTWKPEQ